MVKLFSNVKYVNIPKVLMEIKKIKEKESFFN